MPSLRKHSTKDLWNIVLNVRRRQEKGEGSIMSMLADTILCQQAMVGIMLRDKRDRDEQNAEATNTKYSYSFQPAGETTQRFYGATARFKSEGPAGIEEAVHVADSTISLDPDGQGNGARG